MKNKILFTTIVLMSFICKAQDIEVMTLGTFHFKFPNRDVVKFSDDKQIDVFDAQYQKEIKQIVSKLEAFKPTIIAIEREPEEQPKIDSLYNLYLKDEHQLTRSEDQQLGFRLAKQLGLKKVYGVDDGARFYLEIEELFERKDSTAYAKFMDYFNNNPDSEKFQYSKNLFKEKGILAELKSMNSEENITKSLGNYLIGIFKYETNENENLGPDFVTGWWFNRNLKIFRNIQKINADSNDRILLIIGAGHINLLNMFFEASPEYHLVETNSYLD